MYPTVGGEAGQRTNGFTEGNSTPRPDLEEQLPVCQFLPDSAVAAARFICMSVAGAWGQVFLPVSCCTFVCVILITFVLFE